MLRVSDCGGFRGLRLSGAAHSAELRRRRLLFAREPAVLSRITAVLARLRGDLRGVLGVCKVDRVAAADAERLRPTPFQMETKFLVRFLAFRCGFRGRGWCFVRRGSRFRELCGEGVSADKRPGNGALISVLWMGGVVVCSESRKRRFAGTVSLGSCSGAILDPCGCGWCRVCLLFENSIVCQVC